MKALYFIVLKTLGSILLGINIGLNSVAAQVLSEPIQNDYHLKLSADIETVAIYETHARVLSKKNYSDDKEAEYSPTDLALGWGRMNEDYIYDQLEFSQDHRWFTWRHREKLVGVSPDEIMLSATNVHMIPGNEEVARKLKKVKAGDIVKIKGYLVNVKSPKGWFWKTSRTRRDSGAGACEIIYATSIEISKTNKPGFLKTFFNFLGLD